MGILEELAVKYGSTKTEHPQYFDAYEGAIGQTRHTINSVLEIGVQGGGSINMWKDYFRTAIVYGVDKKIKCDLNDERIVLIVGPQQEEHTYELIPDVLDIVIDDGSHRMDDQQKSFSILWKRVAPLGWYVVEDLHTSYWPAFGGGIGRNDTTTMFLGHIINAIHAYAATSNRAEKQRIKKVRWGRQVRQMRVYKGIVLIQKEAL